PCHPLDTSMILLHDIVEVFHLTDDDVGALCLIVALDGGFIGVTAVDGDRLGETVAADGFFQKPERGLFIAVLREQKVNRVAVFVHGAIEIAPLPFYFDIGFVHAPTHPYRTLAAMEGLLELRAICDDPPIDGGVIHLYSTFLHEFFDVTRAQRIRHIPADPHENDLRGEMSTFEADRHRRSPS